MDSTDKTEATNSVFKRIKTSYAEGGGAREMLIAVHPLIWTGVRWSIWIPVLTIAGAWVASQLMPWA
ncbi:MAG TPA: hypothetical protein VG897_00990, partial [Terriglobales bacterium]|nr:hypothetical protein [Terriglobales bacterium]